MSTITTSKYNYFGKGSVVVPSDGEGAVRRLAITADRLVTQPIEGIVVIPDVISYAARVNGSREAVGWRNVVRMHYEEKEVKKMVGGKEVTEIKQWKYFELSDFEYISFLDVQERILELARGLLRYGILKTDVFNIYAQTSANWQLMSHACTTISTPVATGYDTLGEAGLAHSLNEARCTGIFTNSELLPTLARVLKDTPSVRLVVYDGDPKSTVIDQIWDVREDIVAVSINELRTIGRAQPLDILEARKPTPDDVALIMYTSGSTGAPKGVVLTHGNVVASIGGVYNLLGHHLHADDTFLAYLPLAHIFEYVVEMTLLMVGMKIGYGRVKTLTDASVRNCNGDFLAFRPTILVGVPQVWETIRKGILTKVNASRSLRKSVFNGAMAIKKANVPLFSNVVDVAVMSGVRAATGGRLRLAMSAGAGLSKETQEFLSVALVTMLQGYGMTESCAMCAMLPPELMQYGSVGLPAPCVEIKLIDVAEVGYLAYGNPPQGEICIRGPAVTKGYYKRPDLNEDETIFTKDGWLRTGDVGQWNPDGTLSLIDRIKNLVKLQGGDAKQPIATIIEPRHPHIDPTPTIRRVVEQTLRHMPRVLIDTTTGRLHDKTQQALAFEKFPIYDELRSSMATRLDPARIGEEVKKFYRYVMFSHKWEYSEPLFQTVEHISIYKLKSSSPNIKLQRFCKLARSLGFQWAWSDTCCIDKKDNVVLQESLVAMFTWYRGSSLTVVYLRGVWSQSQQPGDLRNSIWNTRAWPYQEYVAAETIQFYTEDWKPYLGSTLFNHKELPAIISEMQHVTRVFAQESAVFCPGLDRVREKLSVASVRQTTLVEDIAYSLLGIFNASIPIIYGEGNRAVGRLLEHVLTGSGDVTILAWTGRAGDYNSCLPVDLAVYSELVPPHVPQPIKKVEMNRMITTLRSSLPDLFLAVALHKQFSQLPLPSLSANRLRLPGIVFHLAELFHVPAQDPSLHAYRATTSTFGDVEIETTDDLTGMKDLCLVHPWIRPLLDQEFSDGATALDITTQALRFVARLRQPFGALLFKPLSRVEYRRVATDSLILVQIHKKVSLTELMDNTRTIEVH